MEEITTTTTTNDEDDEDEKIESSESGGKWIGWLAGLIELTTETCCLASQFSFFCYHWAPAMDSFLSATNQSGSLNKLVALIDIPLTLSCLMSDCWSWQRLMMSLIICAADCVDVISLNTTCQDALARQQNFRQVSDDRPNEWKCLEVKCFHHLSLTILSFIYETSVAWLPQLALDRPSKFSEISEQVIRLEQAKPSKLWILLMNQPVVWWSD